MTNSQEYELHVLNELIVATLDNADGYHRAAPADDFETAIVFKQRASERFEVAEQLQAQVRAFDGKPAHLGSILAAAYAVLANYHQASRTEQQHSLVQDDHQLQRRYEEALQDGRLSSFVKDTIRSAYERIRAEHEWSPHVVAQ